MWNSRHHGHLSASLQEKEKATLLNLNFVLTVVQLNATRGTYRWKAR